MAAPEVLENIAEQYAPGYNLPDLLFTRNQEAAARDRSWASIRRLWESFLRAERAGRVPAHPLHFYVHIPFCRQKCSYCYYYSKALRSRADLSEYLKSLTRVMAYFSDTFSGRSFQTLYFGGGTPSILEPGQIGLFMQVLFNRFAFDEKGEKTLECSPVSVSGAKLRLLKRFGFNRISMGVQSSDPGILSAEHRGYQSRPMVERAVRTVRDAGRFMLNLDLLLGMRGDSRESFLETFRETLRYGPEEITVYPISPTHRYLDAHYHGKAAEFHGSLRERYAGAAEKALRMALDRGYVCSEGLALEDHSWLFQKTELLRQSQFSAVYNDVSSAPMSMFGIGPTSQSRIMGRLSYMQMATPARVFDPATRACRGLPLSLRDEMLKYVFMALWKTRTLSKKEFRRLFGRELSAVFSRELRGLKSRGEVRESREEFRLVRKDNKSRLTACLGLMETARLDEMFTARLVIRTRRGEFPLELKRTRAGEEYAVEVRGLGLRALGDSDAVFGAESGQAVQLLVSLFKRLAARPPKGGVPALAARYRAELGRILKGLKGKGFLKDARLA